MGAVEEVMEAVEEVMGEGGGGLEAAGTGVVGEVADSGVAVVEGKGLRKLPAASKSQPCNRRTSLWRTRRRLRRSLILNRDS